MKKEKSNNINLIPQYRRNLLVTFQSRLSIKFKSIFLLEMAFTHRSYANEEGKFAINNERLEFLGDSVLGVTVASYLYKILPDHQEGDLARIKSIVVSEMTLSEIAVQIGIDTCLLLGKGEEHSGGRTKKAILADALEATFGAYYLDSGFIEAEKLILKLLIPEIEKVLENKHHRDYKTILQEYLQKKSKQCPKYLLVKKTGPDHDKVFWISVELNKQVFGPVTGKNKKEAEQAAAKYCIDQLELDISNENYL